MEWMAMAELLVSFTRLLKSPRLVLKHAISEELGNLIWYMCAKNVHTFSSMENINRFHHWHQQWAPLSLKPSRAHWQCGWQTTSWRFSQRCNLPRVYMPTTSYQVFKLYIRKLSHNTRMETRIFLSNMAILKLRTFYKVLSGQVTRVLPSNY